MLSGRSHSSWRLLQTRRQITSECTLRSSDTKLRETNVPSPVPPRRCPLAVGVRRTLGGTTELRELDVALRLPEGKARSPQASPRAEGGGGLGTLGTLIPFGRLPRGRSRPTPPKNLQPPPTPPSLKRLSLGKCLDKLLSHYLLSKVCFWTLLLPREGSRVTIPDCSILLSMPLCNTLKNIDLEQARYHPEAHELYEKIVCHMLMMFDS